RWHAVHGVVAERPARAAVTAAARLPGTDRDAVQIEVAAAHAPVVERLAGAEQGACAGQRPEPRAALATQRDLALRLDACAADRAGDAAGDEDGAAGHGERVVRRLECRRAIRRAVADRAERAYVARAGRVAIVRRAGRAQRRCGERAEQRQDERPRSGAG